MKQKQMQGGKFVRQACHEFAELMAQEIERLEGIHKGSMEIYNGLLKTLIEPETVLWSPEEYRRILLKTIIGRLENFLAAISENIRLKDVKLLELIQRVADNYNKLDQAKVKSD